MRGPGDAAIMFVAAFCAYLMVSCCASSFDECPGHHLVSDSAIYEAVSRIVGIYYNTDTSVKELLWRPFIVNIKLVFFDAESIFQPFTRYCMGRDSMVDVEIECRWTLDVEYALQDKKADFSGLATLSFDESVAKVQFRLDFSSGNQTFTLSPQGVRLTWPGTASVFVYNLYSDVVSVIMNLLAKLYADELVRWTSGRSVIKNFITQKAGELAPFHVEH